MYQINSEAFEDCMEGIKHLAPLHMEEVGFTDGTPMSVAYDKYLQLDKAGILSTVSLRYSGNLVGYCIDIISPSLHYSKSIFAVNDSIFIQKEHRGVQAFRLLKYVENMHKKNEVHMHAIHMKPKNKFDGLVERLGYSLTDLVYTKQLGEK